MVYEGGGNCYERKMDEELDFSSLELFMDIMCIFFLVLLCEVVFHSAIER